MNLILDNFENDMTTGNLFLGDYGNAVLDTDKLE
jgi:hypothetical protein